MKDKKPSKSKGLKPGDADLWQALTADVRPLPGKAYEAPAPEEADEAQPYIHETIVLPPKATPADLPTGRGLDGRTDERLRRGEIKIEARLDLHGMTQDRALPALQDFIRRSYEQGRRCVLVITGTGRRSKNQREHEWFEQAPGILKERVPEWLESEPTARFVLKSHPAKRKDGGEGALYVYLRKRRD